MNKLVFLIVLIVATLRQSFSMNCGEFYYSKAQVDQLLNTHTDQLVSFLKASSLPAFYRRIGDKRVPVVLINKTTYPQLVPYLKNTFSQVIQLQPGAFNGGHGMALYGPRDFSHRTWYSPGSTTPREDQIIGLHDSYVQVLDFLKTIEKSKSTYALFNYRLDPLEEVMIGRYLKVRRAGLFHVPSGFNSAEAIPGAFQKLCTRGEKCYDYIAATVAQDDSINLMKYHLWENFGKQADADEILHRQEIKRIVNDLVFEIDKVNTEIFIPIDLSRSIDVKSMSELLHPHMLKKQVFMNRLRLIMPEHTSDEVIEKTLNLLVGVNVLEDYKRAMTRIGLDKYDVWPDHLNGSSRLNAIYIVHTENVPSTSQDYSKVVEDFFSGKYENTLGATKHHMGDNVRWHTPLHR